MANKEWQYDEDTGTLMARCPNCSGRVAIYVYTYENPYHYCPYCGTELDDGNIKKARAKVYGDKE